MKRPSTLRNRLLAPLITIAALLLMFEDWCWELGMALVRRVVAWPPLHALESRICALSPRVALCLFVLPAILLFPVKVMALVAIAHGHPVTGVGVIVLAKLLGAAVVARVYALTLPALLTLVWFARGHGGFMRVKARWIGHLKASPHWQHCVATSARLRAAVRALARRATPALPRGGRHASRPARMLRRYIALWRARRRQPGQPRRAAHAEPHDQRHDAP
jgi:hypothetical protein